MPEPVNPNANPAARELLDRLYALSGKVTLSGMHNQMHHMSEPSERIEKITGHYPLVWGGEWGFSDERHNIDNIKYRPRLLEQIREKHAAGRIVVVTYHQASPTVSEPCDFQGGVICNLTDEEWDEVLTEGTRLHTVWAEHVDRLARAFKELEDIPIVFRPYHEMNGGWFWWGGDPERLKALWNLIYDRFTHRHGLNNLLWAWHCDRPWEGVEQFYPGHETVDLLGADIYPLKDRDEVYPQEWYDRMRDLADGRPTALSEMSVLPSPEILERQPWDWFMCWDNLAFHANTEEKIRQVFSSPRVVSKLS